MGLVLPLGDQVGIAAVRSCGMGVIAKSKTKMAYWYLIRAQEGIFAPSQQFNNSQGKVGEAFWIDFFSFDQKDVKCFWVRVHWKHFSVVFCNLHNLVPPFGNADNPAQSSN